MKKIRYSFLLLISFAFLGWESGYIPHSAIAPSTNSDTLSSILNRTIDSISLEYSMRLPYGSTPSLQLYNDSLLISSFNTESYSEFDREANEFFGIDEKFFDMDIYLIDKNQDAKRLFSGAINSHGNENNPAVSADGKLLVFSYKRNLKSDPRLYYSVFIDGEWQKRKKLIFEDYKDNVSATFPFLTPENDLYFVMPVGSDSLTNLDIYYAPRSGQNWAAPTSPWNGLNTNYNEISPVKMGPNLLFFASDRPGGYGGYDLYVATISDSSCTVSNLGKPFNTALDDLYLLPETEELTQGYVVRYTDSLKVTPDIFAFNLITYATREPLRNDSIVQPDDTNLPKIAIASMAENSDSVKTPNISSVDGRENLNTEDSVQSRPVAALVNSGAQLQQTEMKLTEPNPVGSKELKSWSPISFNTYNLQIELLGSEADGSQNSSANKVLVDRQLSLPPTASSIISIQVID